MSSVARLQPAFGDTDTIRSLVEAWAPYVPLAREAASAEEKAATGAAASTFVPPWFRRNVVTHGHSHVDGAEVILHNPRFEAAAARVHSGAVVEPTTVYVNVMGPAPYPFIAHLDIPVFRCASRRNAPPWLLHRMHASGLWEQERVRLATAVSWIHDGTGGDFHYWPDGPAGACVCEPAPFDDVAIVADNEAVFHGVGPLGSGDEASPLDLTLDAELRHDPATGSWTVHDPDPVVTYDRADVRITISWKAEVFADETERHHVRAVADDPLPIDTIVARFVDDLRSRGRTVAEPDDPLHDPAWIDTLTEAYTLPAPDIPRETP